MCNSCLWPRIPEQICRGTDAPTEESSPTALTRALVEHQCLNQSTGGFCHSVFLQCIWICLTMNACDSCMERGLSNMVFASHLKRIGLTVVDWFVICWLLYLQIWAFDIIAWKDLFWNLLQSCFELMLWLKKKLLCKNSLRFLPWASVVGSAYFTAQALFYLLT